MHINDGEASTRKSPFFSTRWSLVRAAADTRNPDCREALNDLCQTYWPSVYRYFRCRVQDLDEARDLTQGFFTFLLEKKSFKIARPEKGKFRSFLLACAKNYFANETDRARTMKRGGTFTTIRLDFDRAESLHQIEPRQRQTPETLYEKQWAMTVLDQALTRLEEVEGAAPRPEVFHRLKSFLTDDEPGTTYKQVASELNKTESAVKVAVHRLRKRFGSLLREEIAGTVTDPDEVDDEIRHLLSVLDL